MEDGWGEGEGRKVHGVKTLGMGPDRQTDRRTDRGYGWGLNGSASTSVAMGLTPSEFENLFKKAKVTTYLYPFIHVW